MRSIAVPPAIALVAGAYAGSAWAHSIPYGVSVLTCLWLLATAAWTWRRYVVATTALLAGYAVAGLLLGAGAARAALDSPLRTLLDETYGGFGLGEIGPGGVHDPIALRARLLEDAAPLEFGAGLRVRLETITIGGSIHRIDDGVYLTVTGAAAANQVPQWSAGRTIEASAVFRRPARYLNEGVPDFERDLALDDVALIGSVKSALLVRVIHRGTWVEEAAARARAHVRGAVARWITKHDRIAAAIVIAILIGDRSALPDDVRERLQAAGTYHVIAISGGNIAILAALIAGALMFTGMRGRFAALAIIVGLLVYSTIVNAGPSVWRATAMAVVYLAARLLDHRSPPWNAMAISAVALTCAAPLQARDVGFALTFGATSAILAAAARAQSARPVVTTWLITSVAASIAVEVVLLPVTASAFSRATVAGVLLNLLAVPLMTIVQVAGLAVAGFSSVDWLAAPAAALATIGARALVESARLVEGAPWLAFRVPPPPGVLIVTYYLALACSLRPHRHRWASVVVLLACAVAILDGWPARSQEPRGRLRLMMFDVGQAEAMLLQTPDGRTLMVDAGGAGFDGTAFDIGGRVLAPALWARGIRGLDALAITHGDPDHVGGASAVLRDFTPREIWDGIPVPAHRPLQLLLAAARAAGTAVQTKAAETQFRFGDVRIRVLSPSPPDWERQRVRNDDSLVFEIVYGDVALLLTGDASAAVEQSIVHRLTPARIRILKVGHHGSRTSTSQGLVDAWKPQIALVSCGRGNRFGHPAPEVMRRLTEAGVRVYRTDRDGEITVDTDGMDVAVRTYVSATTPTK